MSPFIFKKDRLWYAVLMGGLVMVVAGLVQLFNGFYGNMAGTKGLPPAVVEVGKDQAQNPSGDKNSGDNVKREVKKNQFFVEYRLERDRTRSQQIELLRDIVNNQNSPEKTREEAQRRLLAISQAIDTEMRLENLIRAENFKDAVVFIQEKSTTVIVQTPVLTPMDKERLTQIAVRVTGHKAEDVVVIPKV